MATDGDLVNPVTGPVFTKRKIVGFSVTLDPQIVVVNLARSTADESVTENMPPIYILPADWPSLFNALCGVGSGGPAAFRARLRAWLEANREDELG